MYLAVNKKDNNDVHSFEWSSNDELIVNNMVVDESDWIIVEFEEVKPVNQETNNK